MGDFVNYTPGEYAKEHIRITPTTLADGRDFFYLDDDPEYVSGVKTRELKDPRQLPYRFSNQLNAAGEEVPYAAPEMRRDPLTGDWIPMATARMTGGGFGGSIIALVNKGQGHEIAQKIADRFEKEGFNAPRALPAFAAASASREA